MVNLRIPGPTPIPDNVREALSAQMINHRGPEYAALLGRVTEGLRPFFRTQHDILIYTCSGTGVMEAAIVNTLSPATRSSPSASAPSATASARSPRSTAPT